MPYPGQSIVERAEMLDCTKWGLEFNWKELVSIAVYLKVSRTIKGMTIFHENDSEAYMCIIVDGKVDIVKADDTSRRKMLATLDKGKAFGEMSLIDGGKRSASAMAAEDTTVLILTKEAFERLLQENNVLGIKLLLKISKLISLRLRMTSGILVDYISQTHE